MTKNVTKGKSQANEGVRQWDAFESWGGPRSAADPPVGFRSFLTWEESFS